MAPALESQSAGDRAVVPDFQQLPGRGILTARISGCRMHLTMMHEGFGGLNAYVSSLNSNCRLRLCSDGLFARGYGCLGLAV